MQHDTTDASIPTGGRSVNITMGRNDLANLDAVKVDLDGTSVSHGRGVSQSVRRSVSRRIHRRGKFIMPLPIPTTNRGTSSTPGEDIIEHG
jgi:hypothetical protein